MEFTCWMFGKVWRHFLVLSMCLKRDSLADICSTQGMPVMEDYLYCRDLRKAEK